MFDVKVLLAKPSIPIVVRTAPESFADVVIQVDDNALLRQLFAYGIPYLESRCVSRELWVLFEYLVQHLRSVRLTKCVDDALFQSLVRTVGVEVVDHLNREGQSDRVETELGKPGNDVLD
jgi:hypothetical protein